ncbi:MAG: hypothetical protein RL141_692 [Candidatus Parcubacteria bacterium]|jgi:hypothetical protein
MPLVLAGFAGMEPDFLYLQAATALLEASLEPS